MSAIIPHTTKQIGDAGESRAADFLLSQGVQLLARNFRVKGGEIDLIGRDGAVTIFVEVRARSVRPGADFGGAAASITPRKQRRIILAARHWLARHGDTACRFDCVLIENERLEWLQDAFRAD
jgi:putative endonuclease